MVAAVCVIVGVVLAIALGYWWTFSRFERDWVVSPTPLLFFRRGPLYDDVVLDALKVVLVAVSAVLVIVRARGGLLRGVQVAVVLLLANASVQGLKHWPGPPTGAAEGSEPLSGHAGLVGAVALTWLATSRLDRMSRNAGIAASAVAVTGLVAIVAGKHSPVQVVCPLVICLGWSAALLAVRADRPDLRSRSTAGERGRPPTPATVGRPFSPRRRRQLMSSTAVAGGGLALLLLSFTPPAAWATGLAAPGGALRFPLVTAFVAGAALLVAGATAAAASVLGETFPESSAEREQAWDVQR
jgi:hypothetical protein